MKNYFPNYFKLYKEDSDEEENERDQGHDLQKEKEKEEISSAITTFFQDMKLALKQNLKLNFEESQFLIVTPIEWTGYDYKYNLRFLLLKTGWLLNEDYKNRLIFVNSLKGLIYYLQDADANKYRFQKFGRDYNYLHINTERNGDTAVIQCTIFRINNAKEFSKVSMKLATSDILLSPKIRENGLIKLDRLWKAIYQTVSAKLDAIMPQRRLGGRNLNEYILLKIMEVLNSICKVIL